LLQCSTGACRLFPEAEREPPICPKIGRTLLTSFFSRLWHISVTGSGGITAAG